MSNLSENLKHSYENFKRYAQHGTVPAAAGNNNQVPPVSISLFTILIVLLDQ